MRASGHARCRQPSSRTSARAGSTASRRSSYSTAGEPLIVGCPLRVPLGDRVVPALDDRLRVGHAAASISSRAASNCSSVRRMCECRPRLCGKIPAASTGGASWRSFTATSGLIGNRHDQRIPFGVVLGARRPRRRRRPPARRPRRESPGRRAAPTAAGTTSARGSLPARRAGRAGARRARAPAASGVRGAR